MDSWQIPGYAQQRDFYVKQAAEFRRLKTPQKVVVIVSDALRYEVAEECLREIRKLNRFDAELTPMISALPSYTQLGMAALLPNKDLTIAGDGGVTSFGMPTQGTVNREKVLGLGRPGDRVKAMKAGEFMDLRVDQGKEIFRDHDVLYLYHNRIDVVGDKLATEERVFEAAEDAIEDLTKLVRKLTSANFSNILITADHGFLYQHRELQETDFSVADPTGEEILFRNRRFLIGRGLNETAGMKRLTPEALGLAGDLDILIPNSINRLRVKGSGSRFVHGGATLQEVVIPVLRVGKRREEDIGKVEVQIVVTGRSLISSGQTAVTLYQVQSVSEKQQQRVLRAGIYAEDGTLISDEHLLTFDYTSDNISPDQDDDTFVVIEHDAQMPAPVVPPPAKPALAEGHHVFAENRKGISFDKLFGPYIDGARRIIVTDPYIRYYYQVKNMMEFVEMIIQRKAPEDQVAVHLVTVPNDGEIQKQRDLLDSISEACTGTGVDFTWAFDTSGTAHARDIVTDTGWKIVLDRGLDIFQAPIRREGFNLGDRLQEHRMAKGFYVTYVRQ